MLLFGILVFTTLHGQTTIYTESFEAVGGDHGYTLDPANNCDCCGTNDAFGRTQGTNSCLLPVFGTTGSYYFGAEDVDDTNIGTGSVNGVGLVILDPVNVSSYSSLEMSIDIGIGPTPGQFEYGDVVRLQYSMDGGAWTTFGQFASNASLGGSLDLDANMDGFGDGAGMSSTLQSYDFNIPATGNTLQVRLYIRVNSASEEIAIDQLVLTGNNCTQPDAPTLSTNTPSVCVGSSVTLDMNGSLNGATQWNVYTGSCGGTLVGSTSSNSINVTPSYPGETYFIRGEGGCSTPGTCESITISVMQPLAGFGQSASLICAGEQVAFTDVSIDATYWLWDFGDGSTSTLQHPTHQYNSPGIYDVTLLIGNNTGCADTYIAQAAVTVATAPSGVSAGADQTVCSTSDTYMAASIPGGGTSGQWTALNGGTIDDPNDPNTLLTGLSSGSYTFVWTVSNANCSASDTVVITVGTPPNPGFTYTVTNGYVVFTPDYQSNTADYLWTPNEIGGDTNMVFGYQYTAPGDYVVCLTVSENGCDSTFCDTITISSVTSIAENTSNPMELSVFPNPFRDVTTVRYQLQSDARVRIAVYDLSGKVVYDADEGFQPSGVQEHTITADSGDWEQGVYLLRLIIDGHSFSKRIVKIE